MGIIDKDGFKFYDGLNSDYILVQDKNLNQYVDYIYKKEIKCLAINDVFGYEKKDINFLKNCSSVVEIAIDSTKIENFSGLYSIKNLKVLRIEEANSIIDFSHFPELVELSIVCNKNVKNINNCNKLKELSLWKYKPKSKNLIEFINLSNLKSLALTQANIESLKGIGELKKIEKLELNYLRNYEYINEIEKNYKTIKSLQFDNCKKIKNHEYVVSLKNLEVLAFNSCGEIQSIKFIKELPKLKSFIFVATNIVDGDLSPCIGLENVGFHDKKHYSHKYKEFK